MFRKQLSRLSAAAWMMRLVPIPFGILTAKLTADTVSAAVSGSPRGTLMSGSALLALICLIRAAGAAAETAFGKASAKRLHECKMSLYERFLSSPLSSLSEAGTGEAKEKLTDDFNAVTSRRLSLIPGFFTALITAAAYAVVIAAGSWRISSALLGISLLQFLPPVIVKRYLEKNYTDCREIEAKITDHTVAGLKGMAEIKLFGLAGWWDEKMAAYHREYLRIGYGSDLAGTVESSMDTLLSLILRYGSCAVIGLFALYGMSDISTGVQAIALSGPLFAAVKTMFDSIPGFGIAKQAEKRLSSWTGGSGAGSSAETAKIEIDCLSFSAGGKKIFDRAGAVIDAGKITVIRGENGSGKSTLLKLIVGICEPDGGHISVGGASPSELAPDEFPRKIFFLPQEDADIGLSPSEIFVSADADETAEAFGLASDTLKRPLSSLSGGERRKAFLAAAFSARPPILLLDEPTNFLDAAGVSALAMMLKKRAREGLGAVIVTHDDRIAGLAKETFVVSEGGIRRER